MLLFSFFNSAALPFCWLCQAFMPLMLIMLYTLIHLSNGQLSPLPSLQEISADKSQWWESLDWDCHNTKNVLQPFFIERSFSYLGFIFYGFINQFVVFTFFYLFNFSLISFFFIIKIPLIPYFGNLDRLHFIRNGECLVKGWDWFKINPWPKIRHVI